MHGRYRIATEKTLFAMPETAIGFLADVGGSYFLSRLRDQIGLYLVLTGNRIKGQDNKNVGIATHFVNAASLPALEGELYDLQNAQLIEHVLNKYDQNLPDQFDSSKIARLFNANSLEEIYTNLEKDNSEWSSKQIQLLNKMSPTSLKVTVEQLKRGAQLDLQKCFHMEYQLCQRFLSGNDFSEGVRALLVDRDNKPIWSPSSVKDVDQALVDWYFTPLPQDEKFNF